MTAVLGYVDQRHQADYLTREQAEKRKDEHGCPHCRSLPILAIIPATDLDALHAKLAELIYAVADVVKIIDTERTSEDESAKFGADLLATIIRGALGKRGLYAGLDQ